MPGGLNVLAAVETKIERTFKLSWRGLKLGNGVELPFPDVRTRDFAQGLSVFLEQLYTWKRRDNKDL